MKTMWMCALVALTGCAASMQKQLTEPRILCRPDIPGYDSLSTASEVKVWRNACEEEFQLKMAYIKNRPAVEQAKRGIFWPGFPGSPGYLPGHYPFGVGPTGFGFSFNPACLSGGQVTARQMGEQVLIYQSPICRP